MGREKIQQPAKLNKKKLNEIIKAHKMETKKLNIDVEQKRESLLNDYKNDIDKLFGEKDFEDFVTHLENFIISYAKKIDQAKCAEFKIAIDMIPYNILAHNVKFLKKMQDIVLRFDESNFNFTYFDREIILIHFLKTICTIWNKEHPDLEMQWVQMSNYFVLHITL